MELFFVYRHYMITFIPAYIFALSESKRTTFNNKKKFLYGANKFGHTVYLALAQNVSNLFNEHSAC